MWSGLYWNLTQQGRRVHTRQQAHKVAKLMKTKTNTFWRWQEAPLRERTKTAQTRIMTSKLTTIRQAFIFPVRAYGRNFTSQTIISFIFRRFFAPFSRLKSFSKAFSSLKSFFNLILSTTNNTIFGKITDGWLFSSAGKSCEQNVSSVGDEAAKDIEKQIRLGNTKSERIHLPEQMSHGKF